jgi:hypothetical protein
MNKIPVLLLTFNRLDTTKRVFNLVAQYRPAKLYLASDGPRAHVQDEPHKIEQIRQFLTGNIDWECEVKTLFRPTNLGCKLAVSEGISWFFEHEDCGIILEDDCLPDLSFFNFCAAMLAAYRDDARIMQISGTNFIGRYTPDPQYSYFFSKYGGIWGWASWRRAWKHFDLSPEKYRQAKASETLKGFLGNAYAWRMSLYEQVFEKNLDTWDYQWSFARAINSGLSIVPAVNLVSNIGFGRDASHTHKTTSDIADMQTNELDAQRIQPNPFVVPDQYYDERLIRKLSDGLYRIKPFIRRAKGLLP